MYRHSVVSTCALALLLSACTLDVQLTEDSLTDPSGETETESSANPDPSDPGAGTETVASSDLGGTITDLPADPNPGSTDTTLTAGTVSTEPGSTDGCATTVSSTDTEIMGTVCTGSDVAVNTDPSTEACPTPVSSTDSEVTGTVCTASDVAVNTDPSANPTPDESVPACWSVTSSPTTTESSDMTWTDTCTDTGTEVPPSDTGTVTDTGSVLAEGTDTASGSEISG